MWCISQHFLSSYDKWSEQWVLCAIQEKLEEYVISGGDVRVQKISLDLAKEVHLLKKKKVGQSGGGGGADFTESMAPQVGIV